MPNKPKLSAAEFSALQDFYNATNGPFWRWHNVSVQSNPWNFSIPGVNPCFDDWQGLVCSCGLTSCSVHVLFLDHHNLTGHLPNSIENFSKMSQLILRGNNITGTMTRSIGNLTELEMLDLSYNKFYGEIPSSIGRLSKLLTLNLASNRLEKIPEELYELTGLQGLSLFDNRIVGLISPNIGNLTSLETLQLQANFFSPQLLPKEICRLRLLRNMDVSRIRLLGPFPDCLYGMKSLKSFTSVANKLSCTLSDGIGNLTNLNSLDLSFSKLYGALPASLGNLSNIIVLTLSGNLFTGTVPRSFVNLLNVKALSVQFNLLHGKIDFLTNLNASLFYFHNNAFTGHFEISNTGFPSIVYLDVSVNSLSGSIPFNNNWKRIRGYEVYRNYFSSTLPSFANTSLMLIMATFSNYLTSTIPYDLFTDTRHLYYLGLSKNLLTGTIPGEITQFPLLNQLLLSQNFLTGTLPNFKNSTYLVVLDVSTNQLRGRLADSLVDIEFLEQLFLQDNSFTGPIQDVVNSTLQKQLVNVDLSSNDLSGTIPQALFLNAKRLATFAASSNCLDGDIPAEICQSRSLVSLSLDGLTTSARCTELVFPGLSTLNGFIVTHFLEGTIPSCLYEMPSLELLHLSGNGLTGSIPSNMNLSSQLTNLALSHNALTGTIPDTVQLRPWVFLDLSYNKLSGTLSPFFEAPPYNSSTFLEVNRLSGQIPTTLVQSTADINILNGNIFTCNILGTDLPKHDPEVNSYSCGSDNANNVLYAWIGTIVCILFVVLLYMRLVSKTSLSLRGMFSEVKGKWTTWKAALRRDENRVNLTRLSIYFSEVRQGTLRLTAYCVLILIPVYSLLKLSRSSYTIEYAWRISAMLMNGRTAAVVLFVALMLFALLYVIVLKEIVRKLNVRMPKDISRKSLPQITVRNLQAIERILVYSLVFFFDLVLMLLADFSYVFVVISYDTLVATLAALALALFRFGTNHIILWYALPKTSDILHWIGTRCCKKADEKLSSRLELEFTASDISFLENLTLFNNIIIPGIAIIFILPDCFYNVLFSANDITSYYSYELCYRYAPAKGLSHLCVTGIGTDVYSPSFIYSYQCSSKIVINYVPVYVLMFLIVTIIPFIKITAKLLYQTLRDREDPQSKRFCDFIHQFLPEYFKDFQSSLMDGSIVGKASSSSMEGSDLKRSSFFFRSGDKKKRLFSKLSVTVQINSYLTILMCFGALFPPLTLIAVMSIYIITYFEELWIGWLLTETRGLGLGYEWYEEQIERECEGVEESSNLTIWSTLMVSCCLYGYMIFDTMGDSTGWEGALPMTLILMSMPVVCYGGFRVYRTWVKTEAPGLIEVPKVGGLVQDVEIEVGKVVPRRFSKEENCEANGLSMVNLSPRIQDELSVISNPLYSFDKRK